MCVGSYIWLSSRKNLCVHPSVVPGMRFTGWLFDEQGDGVGVVQVRSWVQYLVASAVCSNTTGLCEAPVLRLVLIKGCVSSHTRCTTLLVHPSPSSFLPSSA